MKIYSKYLNYLKYFIPFLVLGIAAEKKELTASSETLLWKSVVDKVAIEGVSSVQEAFVLVPADYEDKDSPFIPINVRKFKKGTGKSSVNIWYVPGGPGQSSKTLEIMLPGFVQNLPEGATVYAVDHRGLGKSTPLANEEEKDLLTRFPSDSTLLPEILMKKQQKLGILTPLTRALRVENVARDLLKGVQLVLKENPANKHYLLGVSYGTMIARRAVQIAVQGTFEAVILDGLAPVERIELSNESDRILEELCAMIPECQALLAAVTPGESELRVREIIPEILKRNSVEMNSCAAYFTEKLGSRGLCTSLHEMMNASLLQGRSSVKIASLRLLFEMIECRDPEGFAALMNVIHEILSKLQALNQLQGVAVASSTDSSKDKKLPANNATETQKALSTDELVFEVVSALERYDVTNSSLNICYNKKHTTKGDDMETCPTRLFDPCTFFQMTFDRKAALMKIDGALPPISLQSPDVYAPETRFIVLAGNLDFNTPTWLSRQLASKFISGRKVEYHEFFGFGHAMLGSSDCDHEIFSDFLHGTELTSSCVQNWNVKNSAAIEDNFKMSLADLGDFINKAT